ncbi:MAG: alpha-amylase [Bacteroidales bacterium]|nr:alpha-amylase [Candidatus Liminaster caballi]
MKISTITVLVISAIAGLLSACKTAPKDAAQNAATTRPAEVILHAWSWSFNTIRENLSDIAAAGYTIIQTSPAQHCVTTTPEDPVGGNQIYGDGRWYYYYQPTDWKIGNYILGTREELIALCQEAAKYNLRIIVDVLPNHTAVDITKVEADLNAAVGGQQNLYHDGGFTDVIDYNDRMQCTNWMMGGLPDVNTENADFQHYFMLYINDLLECGVRGFRYDTAKHIALPSDPKDKRSAENDFWPVVMGRKPVKGLSLAIPADQLFIYGEVLQDKNVKEVEYAEYMGLTASSLGDVLRENLSHGSWLIADASDFHHPVSPEKLVTWVESHDTYCNEHVSASLSDTKIALGWVFLAARQHGTPLFYSRPDGSDGPNGNYWGNNVIGLKGNDMFKDSVVVAANRFRRLMTGLDEQISVDASGSVCQVARGDRGAAIINISDEAQVVALNTPLADGTYTDLISGSQYVVSDHQLNIAVMPLTSYILCNEK